MEEMKRLDRYSSPAWWQLVVQVARNLRNALRNPAGTWVVPQLTTLRIEREHSDLGSLASGVYYGVADGLDLLPSTSRQASALVI